jgi:hypothetical protein
VLSETGSVLLEDAARHNFLMPRNVGHLIGSLDRDFEPAQVHIFNNRNNKLLNKRQIIE